MRRTVALVGRVRIVGIARTGCGSRTVLLCAGMRVSGRIGLRGTGGEFPEVVDAGLREFRIEGHGRIVRLGVGRAVRRGCTSY